MSFFCFVFFVRVAGSSLLFVTIEHWSAKKLLKILAFSLKLVTNLSWCSSGEMQGIFHLFRQVFNIDQYDFWLVLGSNNLWDKLVWYRFLDSSIKEFNFVWRNWNWLKNFKDLSLPMQDLYAWFLSRISCLISLFIQGGSLPSPSDLIQNYSQMLQNHLVIGLANDIKMHSCKYWIPRIFKGRKFL